MKRVYLVNPEFTKALSGAPQTPQLLDRFFVTCLYGKFFWGTPRRDGVDLILVADDEAVPVEIKIRRDTRSGDDGALFKFVKA